MYRVFGAWVICPLTVCVCVCVFDGVDWSGLIFVHSCPLVTSLAESLSAQIILMLFKLGLRFLSLCIIGELFIMWKGEGSEALCSKNRTSVLSLLGHLGA